MTQGKACSIKGCTNKYYAKSYCGKHYANVSRHGSPEAPNRSKRIEFLIDPNNCFVCTSHSKNKDGYPIVSYNKKTWIASRFVYTQMFGEIPNGLLVRHTCDNPNCINPEHLIVGTPQDNMNDRDERGRTPKGESHYNSKLKEKQVLEIKKLLSKGARGRDIAEMFQVDEKVISNIKLGRRWKDTKLEESK